jgi:hypothetical protein
VGVAVEVLRAQQGAARAAALRARPPRRHAMIHRAARGADTFNGRHRNSMLPILGSGNVAMPNFSM